MFQVGDLVYCDSPLGRKRYGVVFSIEGRSVWARWADSPEKALTYKPHRYAHNPLSTCHIYESNQVKWESLLTQ